MSSSRAKAAQTRTLIVSEAARQFRARGFSGIGVAELMGQLGLTHGGFYAHFQSKADLIQMACRSAVSDMLEDWRAKAAQAPHDPLGAIIKPYLSAQHRDNPDTGCLLAALGPEAARQDALVRQAVAECMAAVIDTLAEHMPQGSAANRRKGAIVLFSTLVGAMVAARAATDARLSDELLATVAESLLWDGGPPGLQEDPSP